MNRIMIYCIIMFFLSLFGLVHTKMHVQTLRDGITSMESKKLKLTESVKVLKAEWSYLNKLDRLESLANQYLKLNKIGLSNIRSINECSSEVLKVEKVKHNKSLQSTVNWKYKSRQVILPNNTDAKKK